MKSYDLAVIGSGPGGYVAALYAARHHLSVCVAEKDLLGGTCLNRGCVPTKTMLQTAALLSAIKESSFHGIEINSYRLNTNRIFERRDDVVTKLRGGIETLFKAARIDLIHGTATLKDGQTLSVDGTEVSARAIIIAVGSAPVAIPAIPFDGTSILSSDHVLALRELPKSLIIIGGGVIGCEFATLFSELGIAVTVIEMLDRLIPLQSREASRKMEAVFTKRGIRVITAARVEAIERGETVTARLSTGAAVEAERTLVCIGRAPATAGLSLEQAGIKTEKGRIIVSDTLHTTVPTVYAIGDCVAGPLLAHKASYDGILAVDNILGSPRTVDYTTIPSCVYTDPEVASIGLTEEAARQQHPGLTIARFPYRASAKALIMNRTEGFCKIIADAQGRLLGIEIFGEDACNLIGEATLALKLGATVSDLAHVVHGHPTLSEIFQEAAHLFAGAGVHAV